VVLGALGSSPAHAQNASAEALFVEGGRLMADGKLAQACEAFEASNRAEPRAGTLIRLGDCRKQGDQLASAWSAYKDALIRVKDDRKRKIATAKAAALEPRLSHLTISVSDDSRIEGLVIVYDGRSFDPVLWNRALPVDGGEHVIAARAPGHEDWQTTARVDVAHDQVTVEVPRLVEIRRTVSTSIPPVAEPDRRATPGDAGAPEAASSDSALTTRRKLAIGFAGASILSAVAGAALGSLAQAKLNDALMLCHERAAPCAQAGQANALIESGNARASEANVAFGVAIATVLGAGVLWFTGAPESEPAARIAIFPRFAQGSASLDVTGRF